MQEASAVSKVVQYVAVSLILVASTLVIGCEAPSAQGGVAGQPRRTPIVTTTDAVVSPIKASPPSVMRN